MSTGRGRWGLRHRQSRAAIRSSPAAICYQGAFDYPTQDLQVTATTPEPVPPTATLGEVTRQGCEVSIPVTTTGTGPFVLTVWDDGDVVDDMTWDPGTGPTTTVLNWVITAPAGEQSPGVGLYVTVTFDGEQLELADIDPFEYPASVAQACGEAGGMSVVLVDYADSVTSGGTVEVEASGFWPGEQVTVDLHSDPVQLATLTADANGTVSGSLVIPASTPPGDHTLVLTGVLSLLTTQIGVVVAAQGVPDPTQPGVTVTAAATETETETETATRPRPRPQPKPRPRPQPRLRRRPQPQPHIRLRLSPQPRTGLLMAAAPGPPRARSRRWQQPATARPWLPPAPTPPG